MMNLKVALSVAVVDDDEDDDDDDDKGDGGNTDNGVRLE